MIAASILVAWLAGAPQAATIRGLVTDTKTSAPVADAQVAIVELSRTARTAADGRFEFRGVPPGSYTITVFPSACAGKSP